MNRFTRVWALGATAALIVIGTLGLAGPASAATYSLYGTVPKGGAGSSSGTITFTSAYRFTWSGNVRDVCPGDGHGVEVQLVVRHTDGTQSVKSNVLQDLNGCGSTSVSGSGAFTESKKVKNVMVVLYSTEDGDPWVTLALSPDKDNPMT